MKKTLPIDYNFLLPDIPQNLTRLGVKKDGGYIVNEDIITKSNTLITLGMGNEFSFEKDFLNMNKNKNVFIYDFSVGHKHYIKEFFKNIRRLFKFKRSIKDLIKWFNEYYDFVSFTSNKNVFFFPRKICRKKNISNDITLQEIFENQNLIHKNNIILKIDIEGTEYNIVDEVLKYQNQIGHLIMEYHDLHTRKEEFFNNIKKIKKYFLLNHLHANNYNKTNTDGFPINIEVTFTNKKHQTASNKRKFSFPIKELDFPNNPELPDIEINFEK